MVRSLTHICVTRPQWVNWAVLYIHYDIFIITFHQNIVKRVDTFVETMSYFKSFIIKVSRLGSPDHMTWPKVIKLIWSRASNFRHVNLKNYAMNVRKSPSLCLGNVRDSSSILKTYSLYKMNFGSECYLKHISKPKIRTALSKLRVSSHDLEVERGRYVRPKMDITERLCISCHVIKDEEHFVTDCVNNFEKISLREPGLVNWNNREKNWLSNVLRRSLNITSCFSKFLYHSFHTRNLRTSLCV